MPPVVRLTDMTAHGIPLITYRRRVAVGSSTVFINNFSAARLGDAVVEAVPPNPVAQRCPAVLIG